MLIEYPIISSSNWFVALQTVGPVLKHSKKGFVASEVQHLLGFPLGSPRLNAC